jgi:sulfate adenylyltransferase subunit 1
VQYVIRPQTAGNRDYRGYAGRIASGMLRVGDRVTVLPSGRTTTISGIDALGRAVDTAWAPQSVTVLLADDLDVSRGDLIAPTETAPEITRDIRATVCHLHERPLQVGERVLLKHATRTVKAVVRALPYRIDLSHGLRHDNQPAELAVNDIGAVVLRTAEPLPIDAYADSRLTGSFLLIDPADGTTLTAGMAGERFAERPAAADRAADDEGWDF